MATIRPDSVVLFLDFDGVLHPCGGVGPGERFSRKPLLEELLREQTLLHVVIVISSTWREAYSLKSLISIFSADIQPRVIGATPILDDIESDYLRYREIRGWLSRHQEISRWVVLDDDADGFPRHKEIRGVFTDPEIGLKKEDVVSLRSLLSHT